MGENCSCKAVLENVEAEVKERQLLICPSFKGKDMSQFAPVQHRGTLHDACSKGKRGLKRC